MKNNLVEQICKALSEKKANNIDIIDIKDQTVIADYFVICDAPSTTLVKTLSDNVEEKLEAQNEFAARKEGYAQGRWIVLDYTTVIVHIFLTEERSFYNIETLWVKDNNLIQYE